MATYRFRDLPVTSSEWHVSGQYDGMTGILEWCHDYHDAKRTFETMSTDPKASNLTYGRCADQVTLASKLATKAHKGQTRRDGTPYIAHPTRVAHRVLNLVPDQDPLDRDRLAAVAFLHDVLEDTAITREDMLYDGICEEVLTAVQLLTKVDEDIDAYYARLSKNSLARWVKIADMIDNLSDKPNARQLSRYAKYLNQLVNAND